MIYLTGSAIIRQPTSITVRTKEIRLVRDASANSDGFGIALRGGCVDTAATGKNGSRPFVIGHVKANSPAERYVSLTSFPRWRQILISINHLH